MLSSSKFGKFVLAHLFVTLGFFIIVYFIGSYIIRGANHEMSNSYENVSETLGFGHIVIFAPHSKKTYFFFNDYDRMQNFLNEKGWKLKKDPNGTVMYRYANRDLYFNSLREASEYCVEKNLQMRLETEKLY